MRLKERVPATPPAAPVHRYGKPKAGKVATPPPRNHADYDLQPLRVSSLDHYIRIDTDERFHVH